MAVREDGRECVEFLLTSSDDVRFARFVEGGAISI